MINKSKNLLSDLEQIVNASIDPAMFPYKKGNSIRVGKYAVRTTRHGHKIFDCESNCMIAETFSKTAALALAKSSSQEHSNARSMDVILNVDRCIQKWYNDCIFYKHIMSTSKDEIKLDITETRLEIARDKTNSARESLDKYIYS